MICPKCGCRKTIVKDSRPRDDANEIRRRRACFDCDYRFSTYESIDNPNHRYDGLIKHDVENATKTAQKLLSQLLKMG